ncbi:MAG: gamma subclass chorismate mutase AroQ [Pseudomonadota bacterium]
MAAEASLRTGAMVALLAGCLIGIIGLSAEARAAAEPRDVTGRLYAAIAERLGHMQAVAAYKQSKEQPVEDLDREAVVIAAAVDAALLAGLEPGGAHDFFAVQIEAAKDVQRGWLQQWREGGSLPAEIKSLAETRANLTALGDRILSLAGSGRLVHEWSRFEAALTLPYLGTARKRELFDALLALEPFPDRLTQIQSTGVLRVGTTGDYEPFSLTDDGQHFKGIDIDLAENLAEALGVRLELVQTSWPTLTEDLLDGRYDVAMSGVSRTLARARVGHLSTPYFQGGKTPIARCEDQARFHSLAAIDQPGVRVIVNPGGTNEAFVDAQITEAQKVLHEDNRTIFAALLAGAGDVMITDSIEVMLQARKNTGLCGTIEGSLTYQEKGFLMPADPALSTFVNTWLQLRMADGTVERTIQEHLSQSP